MKLTGWLRRNISNGRKMKNGALKLLFISLFISTLFCFNASSQEALKEELFESLKKQEVDLLKQYIEKKDRLKLYNKEGESLMYAALDNWNIPAVEILLENNAPFSYPQIKRLLLTKIQAEEELNITEANYYAHNKIKNYIDPFDSYKVTDSKKTLDNFSPVLSPPSYHELQQIFNKAKPQLELIIARRMRSGIKSNLNYAGLSTGAGIVLPLFKNYSSQITCGEKNISLSHGKEHNTIYLNNGIFQLDQLDMQQSLKQGFSLYFQLTGLYTRRITGMLSSHPDFIRDIAPEDYMLDIRSLDISPSLLFKYGIFYLKSGVEIRKTLKTALLWPVYGENSEYERAAISENMESYTTAMVLGAGIDVQFAYIELGKSFAPTNILQGVPSKVNWSGVSVGVRL